MGTSETVSDHGEVAVDLDPDLQRARQDLHQRPGPQRGLEQEDVVGLQEQDRVLVRVDRRRDVGVDDDGDARHLSDVTVGCRRVTTAGCVERSVGGGDDRTPGAVGLAEKPEPAPRVHHERTLRDVEVTARRVGRLADCRHQERVQLGPGRGGVGVGHGVLARHRADALDLTGTVRTGDHLAVERHVVRPDEVLEDDLVEGDR
jgi:hypothetical protein